MFYAENHFRLRLGSRKSIDVQTWKARQEARAMKYKVKERDGSGGDSSSSSSSRRRRASGDLEKQSLPSNRGTIRLDLWRRIRKLDIHIVEELNQDETFERWYLKVQNWLAFIDVDIFGDSRYLDQLKTMDYLRTGHDSHVHNLTWIIYLIR